MASAFRFAQEELDREFEYRSHVWWLRFEDKPCNGLWVPREGLEKVSVMAVLIGMQGSLPDGWTIRCGPGRCDWYSLGEPGVPFLAAHEGFLTDLMRAVWRSGYDGHVRQAGQGEWIGFRDLAWRDRISQRPDKKPTTKGNDNGRE